MGKKNSNPIFNLCAGLALGLAALPGLAAEVPAQLQWAQRVELTTAVSGTVQEVLVDVGSRVRKNDKLLSLDSRGFRADLQQAQAEVQKARDIQAEAQREMERSQELFERTVLSIHEMELVKIALGKANADLSAAEARLQHARLNLEYATLLSPFAGLVVGRSAEPGQSVVNRLQVTPLLVLVSSERMRAVAEVDTAQLGRLQNGQAVTVRIGDQRLEGKVVRMGLEPSNEPRVTGREALYPLEVEFPMPEPALRSGQMVTLVLP